MAPTTSLADRTWPEVADVASHTDLILCLGSMEQHGPHLPLDTDSIIVEALANGWAKTRPERLLGPVIPVGASGEHAEFPGTISIGTEVVIALVVEAVRSCDQFRHVIVVSWHGGNADALAAAERTLIAEGRPVTFWKPTVEGDAHAGRVETSMMLALAPQRVNLDAAVAGVTESLATLMPRLRVEGVRAVTPIGVLGDPSGASAAEGTGLIAAIVSTFERRSP